MTRDDRLAELLERWETTATKNHSLTPEDLCRDCPDLLDDFRKLLGQIGPVNAVLAGNGIGSLAPDDFAPEIDAGRYRPVSFHARGGLGLVFLAEDGEVGRNVALKCMQRLAAADAHSRQRFIAEAEITGRLEHPGVVPVYGLGRDAHGQPYYAMRFIHGETLGDSAERFHKNTSANPSIRNVELRRLLRHFVAVCETMAYAHARGVIHRDLKPANIMIGPYGETLIVDWGLAKHIAPGLPGETLGISSAPPASRGLSDSEASVQGQAKGSPVYMSPEQARGEWDRVGAASDIYSLGSTLYVLLTGQLAYDGRSAFEVVEKVKAGRFAAPRTVNASVPKALDAICRQAMALRPEDRYAGAKELANDVEQWLADEPVAAWREPFLVRARRWIKRHRTLMTSLAAAVVVACGALGALAAQERRNNRALNEKNEQLAKQNKDLEESNERVEKNFGYARGAVKEMVQQATGNPLLRKPGLVRFQEAMLKTALHYYKNFLAGQKADDPSLQEEFAFAHFAVAIISHETGAEAEARDGYRQTLAVLDRLDATSAPTIERRVSRAAVLVRLGLIECNVGETGPGFDQLDAGISELERLRGENPGDASYPAALALFLTEAASRYETAGRPADAARALERAQRLFEEIDAKPGEEADQITAAIASATCDLATVHFRSGRLKLAGELSDKVAQLVLELRAKYPDDATYRALDWLSGIGGAPIMAAFGKEKGAIALAETARNGLRIAVRLNPELVADKHLLGLACLVLGEIHRTAGRLKEAAASYHEARDLFAALHSASPDNLEHKQNLGSACQHLSLVYRELDEPAKAAVALNEARRQFDDLLRINPKHPQYRFNGATLLNTEAMRLLKGTKAFEAVPFGDYLRRLFGARTAALFADTTAVTAELVFEDADNANFRFFHGIALRNQGAALLLADRTDDSITLMERSRDVLAALAKAAPEAPLYASERDVSLVGVANSLSMAGAARFSDRRRESLSFYERAQAIIDLLRQRRPEDRRVNELFERNLYLWCLTLSTEGQAVTLEKKDLAAAVAIYEAALPLMRKLHAVRPNYNSDWPSRRENLLAYAGISSIWRCQQLDRAKPDQKKEALRVARFGIEALREWNPSPLDPQFNNVRSILGQLEDIRMKTSE